MLFQVLLVQLGLLLQFVCCLSLAFKHFGEPACPIHHFTVILIIILSLVVEHYQFFLAAFLLNQDRPVQISQLHLFLHYHLDHVLKEL
jgi:hypothetical protein